MNPNTTLTVLFVKAKLHYAIWLEARSKLVRSRFEAGRRPVQSQIPLRYLVRSWFEAGRGPVADLLARASSLLAS